MEENAGNTRHDHPQEIKRENGTEGPQQADRRAFLKKSGIGAAVLTHFVLLGGSPSKAWAESGCASDRGGEDVCGPSRQNADECTAAQFDPETGGITPESGDECGRNGTPEGGDQDVCPHPHTSAWGDQCCSARDSSGDCCPNGNDTADPAK